MKEQRYRMKDACTRTGLTERTIRFYIEKGLLTPQQEEMNGRTLTFFGEEDLQRLEEVSVLRKAGFSIDSIVTMTKYPQTIDDILQEQLAAAEQNAADSRAVLEQLRTAAGQRYENVHSLYEALNREPVRNIPVPHTDREPDFSKFEDATEQERLDGIVDYILAQRKQAGRENRRKKRLRAALPWLCIALVYCILIVVSFTPHHVEKSVACYQYHGVDPKLDCMVQVTVRGDLYVPKIVSPYFIGEITVEQVGSDISLLAKFPETWPQPLHFTQKLIFPTTDNYSAELYFTAEDGSEHLLGTLYLQDRNFDSFEIWLYMPLNDQHGRYKGENGTIIGTDMITNAYDDLLNRLR